MASLSVGQTLDHYRIEGFIGAGSMGDVYRGVDSTLGRQVALKILSERHRDNDELRARFTREARAVAATQHPNVVQVFTTGTFDSKPYLAMEFLDGIDLGTSVDRVGAWPSLAVARAVLDAARGLEAAANAGLIHRDVKPSNLVRLTEGKVKVTDFGLAKPLDPGNEPALTAMGVVVGTPDYIAPEQARGDPIDHRVDIYALGGTTFFMLTGRPPYRTGDSSQDKYLKVVARHLRNPVPDARNSNPKVDDELAQLTMAMMNKRASDRPEYPRIIEKLQRIVARLEAEGAPGNLAAAGRLASASGQQLASPTPVAGRPPVEPSRSDSAVTMIRPPDTNPRARSHPDHIASTDASTGGSGYSGVSSSLPDQPVKTSRGLVAITVVSSTVFAVGLGLVLFGPMPAPTIAQPAPVPDASPPPLPDAGPPPKPTPPAGMVLVERDGTPALFVAARPVTEADYAAAVAARKTPSKRAANRPVVNVGYAAAIEFAREQDGRLLTADEWALAAKTAGFEHAGKRVWEWVTEPGASRKRPVRSAPNKASTRTTRRHKDVTFRVARDL